MSDPVDPRDLELLSLPELDGSMYYELAAGPHPQRKFTSPDSVYLSWELEMLLRPMLQASLAGYSDIGDIVAKPGELAKLAENVRKAAAGMATAENVEALNTILGAGRAQAMGVENDIQPVILVLRRTLVRLSDWLAQAEARSDDLTILAL